MSITTAGLAAIAQTSVGSGVPFNNANARLGVGDGSAAFSAAQTDLQGTNKFRKAMDGGYPTVNGAAVTYKATFAEAEANFHWLEWGIFNAASDGTMLSRVAEDNSTKLNTQTWVLEVTVTYTA